MKAAASLEEIAYVSILQWITHKKDQPIIKSVQSETAVQTNVQFINEHM